MPRSHDGEVTAVERRHLGRPEPLGGCDDGGLHRPERQIVVPRDQFGNADRIIGVQRLDDEGAAGQVPEEADLGLPPQTGADQIGDLGYDESGEDERAGMGFEQFQAGGVVCIIAVDICIERPGVEDQRDGAVSEARISSIRSEMSL